MRKTHPACRKSDGLLESLKLKTHCNQVKFLPPKREAFHERGGFCSGPSEY